MHRVVLFIALRQLWDRKLLNSIAVLGVTLGVLTLIGINGIMQGFQVKFPSNIIKISPHVTIFDKQLRPAPPMLARYEDDFVVARVAHETPSDRQLRINRPAEIVRAIMMACSTTRLPPVRAVMASASRIGTPDEMRVPRVRVKRATEDLRMRSPKTGTFSRSRSMIIRPLSVL